jgi:predicted ATP-dependent serine protease
MHGTNSYPFLIDEEGINVTPITSMALTHGAPTDRVSTGVASLDEMLGGHGIFRGSSTLVSGNAGTGKTSVAARISWMLHAAAARARCTTRTEKSETPIIRSKTCTRTRQQR